MRPPGTQDMSHQGEGNAVSVTSQISHNLFVSLNNTNAASEEPEAHASGACLLLPSECPWFEPPMSSSPMS